MPALLLKRVGQLEAGHAISKPPLMGPSEWILREVNAAQQTPALIPWSLLHATCPTPVKELDLSHEYRLIGTSQILTGSSLVSFFMSEEKAQ